MTGPRLYRPGDPAKRIHWKASAKARELHTKQYELPLEEQCRILLDNRPGERGGEEALIYQDLMCECAASLARHGLERGHETVLQECREDRGAVSGRLMSDFSALYDWLALLPFDGDLPVEEALSLARRTGENLRVLYLLTDGLAPAAAEVLRALAGRGCEIRCVLIAPGGGQRETTADFPCVTVTRGEELPARLGGVLL